MSRFFSSKYSSLVPYIPGEQPKDCQYIKLNTNESPFEPTAKAIEATKEQAQKLALYPDPTYSDLHKALANELGVNTDEVLATNGSDEILNFAFMAFCDANTPAVFPNITYGFYSVFAEINNIPYEEIPLTKDFEINIDDYIGINKNIFIANPNAPTGIALAVDQIEQIVKSNPDNVVVIDEAYVEFGAQSCVGLIDNYPNLLVTRTFSKSHSMAGARLGYGVACKELIADLNAIKYSTNPYNVNRMSAAMGIAMIEDNAQVKANCNQIVQNRKVACDELKKLGFEFTDSKANFIFAKHNKIDGKTIYEKLKSNGVLVRHFDKSEICDYNRITVGSAEQMNRLIAEIKKIVEEEL